MSALSKPPRISGSGSTRRPTTGAGAGPRSVLSWAMARTGSGILAGAIQIVDLYHAHEHLWDLARKLYPADETAQKHWVRYKLDWLENGKIENLAVALRKTVDLVTNPELAKTIHIEAEYFTTTAIACDNPSSGRRTSLWAQAHRGRVQSRDRFPAQTIRHVLDGARRQFDYRPPLLLRQRQIRKLLAG